ncbi:hypothetical protein UlMin_000108 [Ulmus minor]
MGILAEIKEKLDDWELDLFWRSCFGHFLDLELEWLEGGKTGKRNTFAGQLVHFLLLRRMRTSKKKEMWFLVEGKPARFSLTKFAMVTGLHCSAIPKISTEQSLHLKNRLRDLYFEGRSQIKQDDLVRGFRSMFNEGEGDSGKKEKRKKKKAAKRGQEREDRVKVALVYFLEGVLLSADAKKNISDFYLSMVDDLAMFNAYPWGSKVYNLMFDSLSSKNLVAKYKERLAKPKEKQIPGVKETYTLLGFLFSFQVSC